MTEWELDDISKWDEMSVRAIEIKEAMEQNFSEDTVNAMIKNYDERYTDD